MIAVTSLARLGRMIADHPEETRRDAHLRDLVGHLAGEPGALTALGDLIGKEARKKRPDDELIEAYGFLLGQALEVVRYGVERNHVEALATAAAVRSHIERQARDGRLDGPAVLLLLRRFAAAKLDPGPELTALVGEWVESGGRDAAPSRSQNVAPESLEEMFAPLARAFGDDPFAMHAELAEQAAAFREPHRAFMAGAVLAASDPAVREAAIGWLLDPGPATRRAVAAMLAEAAPAGRVSGVMLRRMIAVRNWVPEEGRTELDAAILAARRSGVDCAPPTAAGPKEIFASAMDGSGAQTVLARLKRPTGQILAAVLLKLDMGVRDAWVRRKLTKRQVQDLLGHVAEEVGLCGGAADGLDVALPHFLATAQASGLSPPFALLDIVECAGLEGVNPRLSPTRERLARLLDSIPARRRNRSAVEAALRRSARWGAEWPFVQSWFEDDDEVAALIDSRRLSAKQKIMRILEKRLPARRARWADIMTWTALSLRGDEVAGAASLDLALVARELLGERPLAEIPAMIAIAGQTVEMAAL